jgi:hypothetical protein
MLALRPMTAADMRGVQGATTTGGMSQLMKGWLKGYQVEAFQGVEEATAKV